MSPRTTRSAYLTSFVAGALVLAASPARAQGDAPAAPVTPAAPASADQPTPAPTPAPEPKEEKKSPWRGSTLLFDQSVTTQTIGLGSDYQSSNPVYEWWFRFAPRYHVYQDKEQDLSLNLWANLYKEFTNSDETTRRSENVIGATTVWATYSRQILKMGDWVTTASVAPVRIGLPTDKAARDSGVILNLGASLGLSQDIPIQGKSATWLSSARLGATAMYNHPFTRATNAVNGDLDRTRQDAAGRTFESDILRGGMMTKHQLNLLFTGALQVHEKVGISASYILLNSWAYRPTSTPCAIDQPGTGCVGFGDNPDAPNFRVTTWLLASVDYDVIPEMSLGVGYYNLAGQIGPDGERRNPLWSPDARMFFTITGNLDAILDDITGIGSGKKATAKRAVPGAGMIGF